LQFWLEAVPYADFNGDNYVDMADYAIAVRILQGRVWVAKHGWVCRNVYSNGRTELARGWTYTVWENKPVKRDLHLDEEGFDWIDSRGAEPICRMNYIFFERLFPELIVEDSNQPVYVDSFVQTEAAPAIVGWEIAGYHNGGDGEIYSPIEDGYVEPRRQGIKKLRLWFDQPMDINSAGLDSITVWSLGSGMQVEPCLVEWDNDYCMVIEFCQALPDRDSYRITVDWGISSAAGYVIVGDRDICLASLQGDANMSGEVNSQDLLAIKAHINEPISPDNARFDINGSNEINVQDMLAAHANIGHSCILCPQ